MTPIELQSRREALGLSRPALADLLHVSQSALACWETGARPVPDVMDHALAEYEELMEQIIDQAVEAIDALGNDHTPVLNVCGSDRELTAAIPALDGLPAVIHRIAMARARVLASKEAPATLATRATPA